MRYVWREWLPPRSIGLGPAGSTDARGNRRGSFSGEVRRMLWVTRSHVHVDRVACPWIITRFIDSDAQFLFVPKSEVLAVAEREGAIPFDTPGAALNHEGDLCTFDIIIRNY